METLEMGALTGNEFRNVAISDVGTQLFALNETITQNEDGDYVTSEATFEYGVPVTAGAEFGGDAESFETPETDLDYIPKVAGRRNFNDVTYTINYTAEKYQRVLNITELKDHQIIRTFMEVFSDGSAMIFQGTSVIPSITAGDTRQINLTIVCSYMKWISNIYELTAEDKQGLETVWYTDNAINIDVASIPTYRPDYFATKYAPASATTTTE